MSYGNAGTYNINGTDYYCSSDAERMWLELVTPGLASGEVKKLVWQPKPGYAIAYKYDKQDCADVYRPDALFRWLLEEEWVIEIKRGRIEQKSVSKIKRFCMQYPEKKVVVVWYGRFPKKGVAKRRLDRLRPHLHHIWQIIK